MSGLLIDTSRYISDEDKIERSISVMRLEAIDTPQIEGKRWTGQMCSPPSNAPSV